MKFLGKVTFWQAGWRRLGPKSRHSTHASARQRRPPYPGSRAFLPTFHPGRNTNGGSYGREEKEEEEDDGEEAEKPRPTAVSVPEKGQAGKSGGAWVTVGGKKKSGVKKVKETRKKDEKKV